MSDNVLIDLILDSQSYDLLPPKQLLETENTVSTTTLIKPLKQMLFTLYQDTPETEDRSKLAFLIGSSIHSTIETILKEQPKCIIEERLTKTINGITISGKPDAIINNILYDFKTTNHFNLEDKTKLHYYTKQLSIYNWLLDSKNTTAKLVYIIKDWKQSSAGYGKMPINPIVIKEIELWDPVKTEIYIQTRLSAIKTFQGIDYSKYPDCSSEDLIQPDSIYKVFKKNSTKAKRVFNTMQEALIYTMDQKDPNDNEIRKITPCCTVCKYCPFKEQCSQYEGDTDNEITLSVPE